MKMNDIHPFAKIDENTNIGQFVYIEENVKIGKNCTIKHHVYICNGVEIEDNCFIGAGTKFINDKFTNIYHEPLDETIIYVCKNTKIGCNCSIMPVFIGENVIIGAGSVVTKNIPDNEIWAGNPAKKLR